MDLFKICIIVILNINTKQSGPTRENTLHDLFIYIKHFFSQATNYSITPCKGQTI